MITAIMFGSAARRCSGENIISRYQMTVLVRRFPAETLCSRTVAGAFSCGVRELKAVHLCKRIKVLRPANINGVYMQT
jgi:hypothetical protein